MNKHNTINININNNKPYQLNSIVDGNDGESHAQVYNNNNNSNKLYRSLIISQQTKLNGNKMNSLKQSLFEAIVVWSNHRIWSNRVFERENRERIELAFHLAMTDWDHKAIESS